MTFSNGCYNFVPSKLIGLVMTLPSFNGLKKGHRHKELEMRSSSFLEVLLSTNDFLFTHKKGSVCSVPNRIHLCKQSYLRAEIESSIDNINSSLRGSRYSLCALSSSSTGCPLLCKNLKDGCREMSMRMVRSFSKVCDKWIFLLITFQESRC